MTKEDKLALNEHEQSLVRLIASRDGVTEDEAASRLVKEALARRAKKKTSGGRVLPLRRPK